MAAKFIALAQAAEMLGVTTDKLDDMRKRGEIHAMRDGTSWKFKKEELERVAEEWGITINPGGEDDGLMDVADLGPAGASELVLELDPEDVGDSPTAIVKSDVPSSLGGKGASKPLISDDSHVSLIPDDDDGSGVNLTGGASDILSGTGGGLKGGAAGSGNLDFDGSGLGIGSNLTLEEEGKQPAASDDDDLTIGDDDEVSLGEEEGMPLEGGSDVTRGAGDTGINLKPSDSGLNLEEVPLDLAGSSVSSLELPEDDDIIALEELEASPDEATQLRADEDFQLAPSSGQTHDEEEDSGSQVIALEDSEAFEDAGAAAPLAGGLEDEDVGALLPAAGGSEEISIQDEVRPVTTPREFLAPPPEMAYSIWNVLSLLAITLVLATVGMLMTDVIRNMWVFDGTFSASTPIMDTMVRLMGLEP